MAARGDISRIIVFLRKSHMNYLRKGKAMEEPKDPKKFGKEREQVEFSQRRSGSIESKRSKGSFSKGSRGEELEIPKEQAQGEISCLCIVVGMKT